MWAPRPAAVDQPAAEQKLAEPSYASFRAADIPQIVRGGARMRVIAGQIDGIEGPMKLATATKRIVGRTWAVADNQVAVLELTY